jgi:hypothetical protein
MQDLEDEGESRLEKLSETWARKRSQEMEEEREPDYRNRGIMARKLSQETKDEKLCEYHSFS